MENDIVQQKQTVPMAIRVYNTRTQPGNCLALAAVV